MKKLNRFAMYDELPLWSAPFGLTLLDTVRLSPEINILDIGSGGGFPMLELAERFGDSCNVYGIDPSEDSVEMINEKIELRNIKNAEIIKSEAESLPFPDSFFQLITANNGLNNVRDEDEVLSSCYRVASPGAQLVFTMNLPHTFIEFYSVFEKVLKQRKMEDKVTEMHRHIFEKRKPVEYWKDKLIRNGFVINSINVDGFKIRFADGSSFFNHYFIRTAFMGPWRSILNGEDETIFSEIGKELDELSVKDNQLVMSVPFVCFDCSKP